MTEEIDGIVSRAAMSLETLADDLEIPRDEFWAALNVAWIDRQRFPPPRLAEAH